MWPWGHLAVGYLAHAGVLDRRFARPPGDAAAVVLALATQLPDLVDKSLAWYVGVLPNGRSLGHSALVAAVVIAVGGWAARRHRWGDLGTAFGVGYASHLLADGLDLFLAGRWAGLGFLGWPVIPAAEPTGPLSILVRFERLAAELAAGDLSTTFAVELALVAVATALWLRHGRPGLTPLGRVRND